MEYEQHILGILLKVGERGISIGALAKHVYNQSCTLFFQPDFQEVRLRVKQYLQRNSRSAKGLVERTGKRGYYRLNTRNSAYARQLLLNSSEDDTSEEEPTTSEKPCQDLSLSLFD